MSARLAAIHIHPVKSAAGIACDVAMLGPYGLQHDREWMIVDPAGRFLTQREDSRLALLQTAIRNGGLHLSNPQGPGPVIDLQHEGELRAVQVWGASCQAFDAGDAVADFLSFWLGRSLRLVRFDARHRRLASPDWTGGRDVPTLFSDGYPLLVLSAGSIADLSARVGRVLPPQRFRANLVIDGADPYEEDAADELRMEGARIRLTKACTRCVITTIDHERGERTDDEPLRTLKTYRFDRVLQGVVFGRNAYVLEGEGAQLRRGMQVSLVSI